jgi:hypothetical protein
MGRAALGLGEYGQREGLRPYPMAPIGSSSRLKATHCDSKGLPADAIKAAANARDVPYQSLIKVWLQEKVKQ